MNIKIKQSPTNAFFFFLFLIFPEIRLLSQDTEIKLKVSLHTAASYYQDVGGQIVCL